MNLQKFDRNRKLYGASSFYIWGIMGNDVHPLLYCDNKYNIISDKSIDESSSLLNDGTYITPVDINQYDDIIKEDLYVLYKGEFFQVHDTYNNFKTIEISSFGLSDDILKKYNFVYDRTMGYASLRLNIDDVELYSSKYSVADEIKNSMSNHLK